MDVGESDLLLDPRRFTRCCQNVLGVHDSHDGIELQFGLHLVIDEEGLGDRAGVGQASGLDQDVVELVAAFSFRLPRNADQVAADGYKQMQPVVHLENLFLGADDQILIDADLSKLVLDDGDAFAVLGRSGMWLSRVVLPAPRKPGQHGDGDARPSLSVLTVMRVSPWVSWRCPCRASPSESASTESWSTES